MFEASLRNSSLSLQVLFEHQNKVDRWEPLRLLCYMLGTWESWRKRFPNKAKLPLVIPIVLFQGASGWSALRSLHALIAVPESAGVAWQGFRAKLHLRAPRRPGTKKTPELCVP
jgi:hypothetical protein